MSMQCQANARSEVLALWRELFDAPPPQDADVRTMLDIIVSNVERKSYTTVRPLPLTR